MVALKMQLEKFTQETVDNNAMHAKPDLRVVLKWMIASSGSVIADVITLGIS